MPEVMAYWRNPEHEIDFVVAPDTFIEVKRGKTSPFEFRWFPTAFPDHRLTVVSASRYDTDGITGVTMEEFLTSEG
ncbi:MAG: hypothetical protein A3K18_20685 [Lentisphaerae bacterium RIFOXYA12_64_32]|nr:MAG: hypothetical protein A3K18_20685 [Lentisphaerae bacterium RIFOXYA12_64_32]